MPESKKNQKVLRGRMKELVQTLNQASRAYYDEDRELMSNFEYDRLYDELEKLEKETGIVMSDSPTVRVGYEVASSLPKEQHPVPMLSLDKTKDPEALAQWLGDHAGILSWKMDGLTVVLTYEKGELSKAVTRGNGIEGEVITANAKTFRNIPRKIPYQKELVVRGEAVISYRDFEEINRRMPETDARYKNPRNLCSGAVRQLDSRITAERNVHFFAFYMAEPSDPELLSTLGNSFENRFRFLKDQGFDVVTYVRVENGREVPAAVQHFAKILPENAFPSDGLVLDLEDVAYGESLGSTAKYPRNAMAFKWKDEEVETTLRQVIWSCSRTGLLNPVAVFDPVELEGTTVQRASVHNITYVKDMALGIGDRIRVYKANMIIPQISENLTRSGNLEIPSVCPVCGGKTEVQKENGTETLHCLNPDCPAKHVKRFTHFASRNAMNIDGISDATMERLIDAGFLHDLHDLYHLDRYREKMVEMEGFGEKSCDKIFQSVEHSRKVDPSAFLYGLGISNVGVSNARVLMKAFGNSLNRLMAASVEEISSVEGIGPVIAESVAAYFQNPKNQKELQLLQQEITFTAEESVPEQDLAGMTFVITGSLQTYPNRDALKKEILQRGGKCAASVSSKTTYLINNDAASSSTKNRKAKELGIPILTEADFKKL